MNQFQFQCTHHQKNYLPSKKISLHQIGPNWSNQQGKTTVTTLHFNDTLHYYNTLNFDEILYCLTTVHYSSQNKTNLHFFLVLSRGVETSSFLCLCSSNVFISVVISIHPSGQTCQIIFFLQLNFAGADSLYLS